MTSRTHAWEALFPAAFFEELARCPLAFFTAAPVEEHGAHNAMAVDMAPMYAVALAVAERTGGIVFPKVPFGEAGAPALTREQLRAPSRAGYPPSLMLSREACRQIYEEVFESMARIGFRGCVALGGHGPVITSLLTLAKERGGKIDGMQLLALHWPALLRPTPLFQEIARRCPRAMAHSGLIETVLMMHLRPEQVDLARVMDVLKTPNASQTMLYLHDPKDPDPERHLRDLQSQATPELGKAVFEELVRLVEAETRAAFDWCPPPAAHAAMG